MKGPKYQLSNGTILAKYCDACFGTGSKTEADPNGFIPKQVFCTTCDGFGALITEDGSQILALVHDILLGGRKRKPSFWDKS
jgi:hypothetical protein